jgi:hypothetical protein
MMIFQLFIFSCVTAFALNGDWTKSCRSSPDAMFQSEDGCMQAGEKWLGRPLFSDVAEDRKVEEFKCIPLVVLK